MKEESPGKNEAGFPEKMFYKIGDVSQILDVKPFVIRYWESEFKQLRPTKNGTGQRVYRKKDILILQRIKELLYEELYTIPGAKRRLELDRLEAKKSGPAQEECREDYGQIRDILRKHKKKLIEIKRFLESYSS
ncbi:MAG: MerR family transcriptional regulator [bacterium]